LVWPPHVQAVLPPLLPLPLLLASPLDS